MSFARSIRTKLSALKSRTASHRCRKLEEHLCRTDEAIEALRAELRTHDAHTKLHLAELYRKEAESHREAQLRFFRSLPAAAGDLRLLQRAEARLLAELDAICRANDIPYWLWAGSLIAAMSRNGSIPWDDDIDVGMMREDARALATALADDERYQLTLVYDGFVFCRQLRFSAREADNPCFIDICLWDWARDCSQEHDDELKQLRIALVEEAETTLAERFPYWEKERWLFSPTSGFVTQAGPVDREGQDPIVAAEEAQAIEAFFEEYEKRARALGILCSKDEAHAVAYGLDNIIYNAPWRRMLYPYESIFPLRDEDYEGVAAMVPHDSVLVCDACYPGWPYLPRDILAGGHFSLQALEEPAVRAALERFVEHSA